MRVIQYYETGDKVPNNAVYLVTREINNPYRRTVVHYFLVDEEVTLNMVNPDHNFTNNGMEKNG